MATDDCKCGHSAESHIYPGSTLFGDCHECPCGLYNPPGGIKDLPIHPLFSFTEDEFRIVSCNHCGPFRVVPDGICESCGWDKDNAGMVEETRPSYCRHSPTREHEIPSIAPSVSANYCRFCLKTIRNGTTIRGEKVMRYWKKRTNRRKKRRWARQARRTAS